MNVNYSDQFGFYLVNGRKTYSKMEAFEWSKFNYNNISWNFNKEIFSAYDWKKEPLQDINYFYDQRAMQLREKYDYIILFYSGGYDSHNILKTFIENNIHIDELIMCIPRKDIMSEDNYEYQNYTIKKLKKYSEKLINTRINIVEYANEFFNMIGKVTGDEILYGNNSKFSVFQIMKDNISKNLVPEHKKIIDSGKKVCYLWGMDKPIIKYQNNNFFCSFDDNTVANFVLTKEQFKNNPEVNTEFFYWSPYSVPLMIKQAHLLKRTYVDLMSTDINLFLNLTRGHEYSGDYEMPKTTSTDQIKSLSFFERFSFHSKTDIHNRTIYPRCIGDEELGYFFNGTESDYHKNIEKIFGNEANMKKYGIYRCMGIRNTWLYVGNSDAATKMRRIIDHYTNILPIFTQNDKYQNTKALRNIYEV